MAANQNSRTVDLDKVRPIRFIYFVLFLLKSGFDMSNWIWFMLHVVIDMDDSEGRHYTDLQTGAKSHNGPIHGFIYVSIAFWFDSLKRKPNLNTERIALIAFHLLDWCIIIALPYRKTVRKVWIWVQAQPEVAEPNWLAKNSTNA